MTEPDEPTAQSPLIPRWLLLSAAAGVLVGFALGAAVSYSWSNAAWGEGFSWAVFAGGGGGWAIGVGIVTAAVIAVRNALRSL